MRKILVSSWRFFLFCLVTWTTFNCAIFFQTIYILYTTPSGPGDLPGWHLRYALNWFISVYFFADWKEWSVFFLCNGIYSFLLLSLWFALCWSLPLYFWLRKQTLGSAFWLAITGAFMGPSLAALLDKMRGWNVGILGICLSFFVLKCLDSLKDQYAPYLRLPDCLQWRRQWISWVPFEKTIARFKKANRQK